MATPSVRRLLAISLVVIAVGLLDAFIGAEWDLFVVLAFSALLQLAIWFQQWANRVPVDLRADLARLLETQAERSGEPFDAVLDRAVAGHLHRLYGRDQLPS